MKALIVEDSRPMRGVLRRFLEELNFEVHEAGDGREGLERLVAGWPFDVVMVDWNMPVMDGGELVREIRRHATCRAARILIVTTDNQPAQVSSALEAGADEYLMKPFDRQALHEKLVLMGVEPEEKAA